MNYKTVKFHPATGAIALALMALLLPACADNNQQATAPTQTASPGNVTPSEVVNKTEQLIGKTVTIRSQPIRKFGPNSFTVSDEQFFGSESILVVNGTGKPVVLPADQNLELQITGQVRNFTIAEVEREFNLTLDRETYVEYENKPAIVAQAIAPAPKAGEITSNPQQFYGKTVAVAGEIEDIQNQNVFTLEDEQLIGGENLLVLHASPNSAAVRDGETVAVTGVVRRFVVAELERDYDLTWTGEIRQQLEAEYSNKPVLVATGIYPSAIRTN